MAFGYVLDFDLNSELKSDSQHEQILNPAVYG